MPAKPKIGKKTATVRKPSKPEVEEVEDVEVEDGLSFEESDEEVEDEDSEEEVVPTVTVKSSGTDEIAFTTLRDISPAPTVGKFSFRQDRGLMKLKKHTRYTAPRNVVFALLDSGAVTLTQ